MREQLHVIESQLGEDDKSEVYDYLEKIDKLKVSDEISDKLTKEAERLEKMPSSSQEAFVIRNYLDTVLELPWNKSTNAKVNLSKAHNVLNKKHYGLEKVKERILESMAVQSLMPKNSRSEERRGGKECRQ